LRFILGALCVDGAASRGGSSGYILTVYGRKESEE
jgi:hypothetical protein